jgi:hypothetical protein
MRDVRTTAHKILVVALVAATVSIVGCKSSPSAPASAQNATATPTNPTQNSDGTTAAANQQTADQPPGQTSRPVQATPAPRPVPPPPPPPPPLVARVGTRIVVRTTESLSASHNDVGDVFSGELAEPLNAHGEIVFPRGTRVKGTVVAAKRHGRFKGAGDLGIQITSIGGYNVQTSEYERERKGKGKRTGGFIGGGAGLGAIIGGIAGGGKGALIGGLAGAGAGTAGAAYTGNNDVVIPSESLVTFRLAAPLSVERHSER